jgi:hypothetical protein
MVEIDELIIKVGEEGFDIVMLIKASEEWVTNTHHFYENECLFRKTLCIAPRCAEYWRDMSVETLLKDKQHIVIDFE